MKRGCYLFLRNRTLSPRAKTVLESVPGCVLITVITPHFVSGYPADLAALGLTTLAACRWTLLPTVMVAIVSAGVLRALLLELGLTHWCRCITE